MSVMRWIGLAVLLFLIVAGVAVGPNLFKAAQSGSEATRQNAEAAIEQAEANITVAETNRRYADAAEAIASPDFRENTEQMLRINNALQFMKDGVRGQFEAQNASGNLTMPQRLCATEVMLDALQVTWEAQNPIENPTQINEFEDSLQSDIQRAFTECQINSALLERNQNHLFSLNKEDSLLAILIENLANRDL